MISDMFEETVNLYYTKYSNNKSDAVIDELLSNDIIINFIAQRVNTFINKNKFLINYKEDFIQEALIAISNSFLKFNSNFNVPLVAYINNNINYAFNNLKDDLRTIKISKGLEQNLNLLNSLLNEYKDEVKVRTLFKEKTNIIKDSTIDSYFEILNEEKASVSLDDNILKDDNDPLTQYYIDVNNKTIEKYLHLLNDKEYEFITLYFGIGREKLNLNEIAIKYNVSKQYVNKVIKNTIKKLQNSNIKNDYINI